GEAKLQCLELGERFAELLALVEMRGGAFERGLGGPERPRLIVDAPAIEPAHRDLEPLSFSAEPMRRRYHRTVEVNLPRRLAVPAHLLFFVTEADAFRVRRHDKARDPAGTGLHASIVLDARHHDE